MIIEPAKTFSRLFRGYDPAAVDAYIEALTAKQQCLLNDVESLSLDPLMGRGWAGPISCDLDCR